MRKLLPAVVAAILTGTLFTLAAKPRDWANFGRYAQANERLSTQPDSCRVVFMGNSITDFWPRHSPEFFTANGFVGRGISGQTSYQMLSRFMADVVALHPRAVVINAGTNDIAENTHPYNPTRTLHNITAMAQLAQANGIAPILSDVLPCRGFYWDTTVTQVPEKIAALNLDLRALAKANGWGYIPYHSALSTPGVCGLDSALTPDGVHPNARGYEIMQRTALPVINSVLEPVR